MKTSQSKIVETIYSAMPYASQIRDLNLDLESTAVRFTWRGDTFRVGGNFSVEQCEDGMLKGSSIAIIIGQLLKQFQ
jgi:hypothetical protein